ncbi:hypothetical protein R5W24_003350 [Gemmata sp. JC717]|uniref:hypothetical protein n=1 Tax=Gemmata algarum TaxID=2975278 RepID=UPI0021BB63D6|nr:hypothetical protein [Gemmata algarum]MDY3554231.1 hypothetical protein [Gemmata algarum]
MTEDHWLGWRDPREFLQSMLYQLSTPDARVFTERRLRLFAVGCSRRVLHLCSNLLVSTAAQAVERFVDGRTNEDRQQLKPVRTAVFASEAWSRTPEGRLARAVVGKGAWGAATETSWYASYLTGGASVRAEEEREQQGLLLRDIVGNPFCPVTADPTWRTSDVLALATGTYGERAFDRMPILADALQDAGCDNPEVLDHCRGPGPHVRGCHVLDLILGKS